MLVKELLTPNRFNLTIYLPNEELNIVHRKDPLIPEKKINNLPS